MGFNISATGEEQMDDSGLSILCGCDQSRIEGLLSSVDTIVTDGETPL